VKTTASKRFCDVALAGCGFAVLAFPLAFLAFAIWLEDQNSPFYRGVRVGLGGKPFRMLKFRSMVPGAWSNGVNSTASDDRRITSVGAFLRRFKLDELPQVWNVLVGNMSFVGPRPQVPFDAALYTEEERRLLEVRPGITDLASIVFADEGDILKGSADPDLLYNQIIRPWKSRLGLAYISRSSLTLDLRIIALTLLSACSRRRALNGVGKLLSAWNVEPVLREAAQRIAPLQPYPAPGASEIAVRYSRQGAAGA
jgi:lipopolysaccharide/colanic/teichoic acid biosynthesis glycosyltransferase